jgi:hypothetical protein
MVAAAASLAACHNRSEEATGAAPVRDTTAVAADTSAQTPPTDSTMGQRPGPTDTTAVTSDTTTTTPAAPTDTTQQSGGWSDSTSMGSDSSNMSMPADSTKQ